jgi:hypothetical protein
MAANGRVKLQHLVPHYVSLARTPSKQHTQKAVQDAHISSKSDGWMQQAITGGPFHLG